MFILWLWRNIKNVLSDSSRTLDLRIAILHIFSGLFAAFFGALICLGAQITSGSPAIGLIICIMLGCLLSLVYAFKSKNLSGLTHITSTLVILILPMIYITAGGFTSGCVIWLLYGLFFIAVAYSGKALIFRLLLMFMLDIGVYHIDYYRPEYVFQLTSRKYIYISVIGSWFIVSLAIIIAVCGYKYIYKHEHALLQDALKHNQEFLQQASHHMRTPINGAVAYADMIQNETDSVQIQRHAQLLVLELNKLSELSNTILQYAPEQKPQVKEIKSSETHRLRCLLIDDTLLNIQFLKIMLSRLFPNADIETAASGEEGIIKCSKQAYDVILTDIMMPTLDGIETMRVLKKINPAIPVIAVTADVSQNAKNRYLSLGFDGYVAKPLNLKELQDAVHNCNLEIKGSTI